MFNLLRRGYLVILALLPLHALLSVWLISNFGHDTPISAWKEILLALLFPFAAIWLMRHPIVARKVFARRINIAILAYLVLHLLLWLVRGVELDAAAAGLLINLRFFAIFVLGQILVVSISELGDGNKPKKQLQENAGKIVLAGAVVVSVFGALQLLALPPDWLSHFGYGLETIEPYRTIDENKDFIRINSTLRGPNPLGLYMILALPLLFIATASKFSFLFSHLSIGKQQLRNFLDEKWKMLNNKWLLSLLLLASLITLYGSHSRSGWLGAALAVSLLVLFNLKPRAKRFVLLTFSVLLIASSVLLITNRGSDFVQNTILHQDPGQGVAENSTEQHWQANRTALAKIASSPLGGGPGTAGPASFYNDSGSSIAENYFLQIGQEVGLVGLALFLYIYFLVASSLWRQKDRAVPAVLLASFIGITLANFFLHGWAQDEIALIWWALAGLYYRQ